MPASSRRLPTILTPPPFALVRNPQYGRGFLKAALGPGLKRVLADKGEFEVNPNKLSGGDVAANVKRVKKHGQAILDDIVRAVDTMPIGFRKIAHALHRQVAEEFGAVVYLKAFSGVFVLRFLCASLTDPVHFKLASKGAISSKQARGLLLISKLLQNLASGVQFGVKEPFMGPFNSFLDANEHAIMEFAASVASLKWARGKAPPQPKVAVSDKDIAMHLETVRLFLESNGEEVDKQQARASIYRKSRIQRDKSRFSTTDNNSGVRKSMVSSGGILRSMQASASNQQLLVEPSGGRSGTIDRATGERPITPEGGKRGERPRSANPRRPSESAPRRTSSKTGKRPTKSRNGSDFKPMARFAADA